MAPKTGITVALVSVLAAAPVAAQFVSLPFTISNDSSAVYGRVAVDSGGRFVVVWNQAGDGSGSGVFARRFTASGTDASGTFPVNSTTPGEQREAAVATGPTGDFLIVWTVGDTSQILGQRYDASGAPRGGEFRVSTTGGETRFPRAAFGGAGSFVVAWQERNAPGGSDYDIFGQRFSASGAALGGTFRVNTELAGWQRKPSIGADAAGNFVIVYESPDADASIGGVRARRFSASGAAFGLEFTVNSTTLGLQEAPRVAVSPSGGFLVAWEGEGDGDGTGIYAQRFTSAGVAAGAELRVNTTTSGYQRGVSVALGQGDSFLATWHVVGPPQQVYGQFLSVNGEPIGSEFRVNATTSSSMAPEVAAGPDGTYVVAWQNFANGILARRLAPPPASLGGAFRVNTTTTGTQFYPVAARGGTGGFVVAWRGFNSIAAQRFSPAGAPAGGQIVIPVSASAALGGVSTDEDGSFVVGFEDLDYGSNDLTLDVYAQRFGSSGAALGAPFKVNAPTTTHHKRPSLASTGGGGFVVVWSGGGADGNGYGVLGRRFSGTGSPLGPEFRVNTVTTGWQTAPIVAGNGTGGFVVVWEAPDGGNDGLFAQRFSSGGAPAGGQFIVNSVTAGYQFIQALVVDPSGGFLVAWTSENVDGDSKAVVARRFTNDGSPLAPQFTVNSQTTGNQSNPVVGRDAAGRYVVAWHSGPDSGASNRVLAKLYKSTGELLGAEFQVNTVTSSSSRPALVFGETWLMAWDQNNGGGDTDVYAVLLVPPCRSSDQNADGAINVADVLYLINNLFAGGPLPRCGGDANGDGALNVADVLYLINFLFAGGPPPT